MADTQNPSELARETLRQMALRRVAPTPENYRTVYHEIAGTVASESFPEKSLKSIGAALPKLTPEQQRFVRQWDSAVQESNWEPIKSGLTDLLNKVGAPPAWGSLIRDLLTQLEVRHSGITSAKKREAVEHVLSASGSPEVMFGRLQSLMRNWAQNSAAEAVLVDAVADSATGSNTDTAATSAATSATDPAWQAANSELRETLARLLTDVIGTMLDDSQEMAEELTGLAADIRTATTPAQVSGFTARLKKFSYRLQFVAEDQTEFRKALLRLLQLILDNVSELVIDDHWMHGQVSVLREVASQPLNLRQIDDIESRLKDLIYKQSTLKQSLTEAQERLREMLASFVDRLAAFADTTGEYHDRIGICAEKIHQAQDISALSEVLDVVMNETRAVQLAAQRSRDEFVEMRDRAREAEQEVVRLQKELENASEMVRHDTLTGALNRKGLEEALVKEVARARRREAPLCLAMLDIDNFKKLNDTLGHDAGDQALVHLSQVVKETLRPQDSLARYGGEEFVVVLSDTGLENGVQVMVRVQRELTRKFFMHRNEKLLITFSCGVAELGREEDPHEAIKRADQAMYLAKRAGKNRVLAA